LTTDDAAWDAPLGVMGKWIDFLIYHAYDPTQHLGFSAFKPSENSSP
jgi:hypothetical protein